MAGILRIAIALDRTSAGVVDSVKVTHAGHSLTLDVSIKSGADGSLELYTAEERKDLLEQALEVEINVNASSERAAA